MKNRIEIKKDKDSEDYYIDIDLDGGLSAINEQEETHE